MKNSLFYSLLGVLFLLALWAHGALHESTRPPSPSAHPVRIISLAPSITETLYALGLGEYVVGVTQFCAYPPDVRTKPQVAGFTDVNHEAVLRLRPDLVLLPQDKGHNKKELENFGLPVLSLDTSSLTGLVHTIALLGKTTGHEQQANSLLAAISDSLAAARTRAEATPEPGVLFSVMHSYQGLGYITEIHAVGQDGFYSELIKAAGGRNVYSGALPFPRLSREAVIFLNPEVIVDIVPDSANLEAIRRDWQELSSVSAIRNNRLHLLADESNTVPGPRFHQTLTRLSQAFHPRAPQEKVE